MNIETLIVDIALVLFAITLCFALPSLVKADDEAQTIEINSEVI